MGIKQQVVVERQEGSLPTFLRGAFPALRELHVAVDEANIRRPSPQASTTNPEPPFLHALAESLTTPAALRSVTVMMIYKEVRSHPCCSALVGKAEVSDTDTPPLRSLLPNLTTLHIHNGAGKSCVAYITAKLPSMVDVLVFDRLRNGASRPNDPGSRN